MGRAVDARKTRPTHDRAVTKPQIVDLLRQGNTLAETCATLRLGRATVWRWVQSDPQFDADFREAQVFGAASAQSGDVLPLRDDRLYVAGFFDGEGCVRIQRGAVQKNGRRYYFPVVLLTNTNEASVRFVHERWPGVFVFKQRNGSTPNSRPVWTWQRSGIAAELFLRDIAPWLRVKQAQASLVSEFLAFVGDRRRTKDRPEEDDARMIDFYVRMTLLNHRGLAPPQVRTD